MKLKTFENFENYSEQEQKALDAGYNIGDTVHNKRMDKNLIIVKESSMVGNSERYCTLGAVGEFLDNYSKVEEIPTNTNRAKDYKSEIRNSIYVAYKKQDVSKIELKDFINHYIDSLN